ncbi:hypothetical protein [Kitasatospora phosalacinea]|uniref:hypothetical protein n=1 Tax=Kitasatospora phosalacinea TaxID=2065 RepID=UPI0005271D24|nr:hypothetical protein [Kitasatospora phosalacinea]
MNRTTRRIAKALVAGSMAAVSLLALAGSASAGGTTGLERGQALVAPNEILKFDANRHLIYVIDVQADGNVVEYRWDYVNHTRTRACWSTGTWWAGDVLATYQDDGNFVVYQRYGYRPIWASNTVGLPGTSVSINDQGVVYVGLKAISGPC